MNKRTYEKLKALLNGIRLFASGALIGSSFFVIWAKHAGILIDDIRLTLVVMLGGLALVFLSVMPALLIEILDGVNKLKSKKEFGSKNK